MSIRKTRYVPILVNALAKGATAAQAAAQAGVSERTAYRRQKEKDIQDQIQVIQDDMLRRATDMLTASLQEGIRSLVELQSEATPPAARRSAARDILEMGLRYREVAEIEKRLVVLEGRAAQTGQSAEDASPAHGPHGAHGPALALHTAPPVKTRRKRGEHTLLMALACGATVPQAAAKAGISERAARRRLTDAALRERINAIRAEIVQRAMALLIAASINAAKTLIDLQSSATPPAVRRRAARDILELSERLRNVTILEQRLVALESQMDPTQAA